MYSSDRYLQAQSQLLEWIEQLEEGSEESLFIHFFFYAVEEADAYRLAAELQDLNFEVEVSHQSELGEQWLCLAGMDLPPDSITFNRCTKLFLELADRYDAQYDGWETRLDLQPGF